MTTLIQFVVLKREDRWMVKSTALERAFPDQRRAVEAAIKLAHDSGKEGKPGVVLFQRTKTDFQKVWTYGESTYPPSKRDLRITLPSPKLREAASASLGHQPHLSPECVFRINFRLRAAPVPRNARDPARHDTEQ